MASKDKKKQLSAEQLLALPISIGEARKQLGSSADGMSDDDIARQILALSEFGLLLLEAMDLQ